MTAEVDRVDGLIKSRIAQNALERSDTVRLAG